VFHSEEGFDMLSPNGEELSPSGEKLSANGSKLFALPLTTVRPEIVEGRACHSRSP
jgi:hypothetical protein